MYYIIYLIILVGALQEAVSHKRNKALFKFAYTALFLLAVFRYGQGQDYFNYEGVYHEVTVYTKQSLLGIFLIDDVGYALLNYIAISLNFSYELFMAIITTLSMAMFYSFLRNSCNYSMVGLLIFYSVIYMIYPLSITRQGLCMSFFLCFMYPLLQRQQTKKFYLLTLLISTIHASSLIFLLFPTIYKLKASNMTLLKIFMLSIIFLFFSMNLMSYIPIAFIQDRMKTYLFEASSNLILAKIVRLVLVLPLLILPPILFKDTLTNKNRLLFYFGFFIYSVLSFSELASSRLWGYFLGIECIIISNLSLSKIKSKLKVLTVYFYIFLSVVLWIKDIDAAIKQGKYKNCTALTYPYVSILEGDNTINYYRKDKGHAYIETRK